jgi:hypothetical protein
MKIPSKPKGMKDPVLMMGKWEERVTPPPTAGHTKVDLKDKSLRLDKDHRAALKGIPYRPASKKK